jgi:hypothetical protein
MNGKIIEKKNRLSISEEMRITPKASHVFGG